MNGRGIPTAAYQVLHLFPEVGYPSWQGNPLARSDGEYLRWGPPARFDWGYLRLGTPWQGYPPRWGTLQGPGLIGGVPEVEYPLTGSPWQGYPLVWTGTGVPPNLDLAKVPPPRCGQTD